MRWDLVLDSNMRGFFCLFVFKDIKSILFIKSRPLQHEGITQNDGNGLGESYFSIPGRGVSNNHSAT